MRQLSLVTSLLVATSLTLGAGSQSPAVCDGLAAAIRRNPDLSGEVAKTDPLTALSSGPKPYLQLVDEKTAESIPSDKTERRTFLRTLTTRFRPTPELSREFGEIFESMSDGEVWSLPGSDLHAVADRGGSAGCQSYVFFRSSPGRSELVAEPPRQDLGPRLSFCSGMGDLGYMARVNGAVAILEYYQGQSAGTFAFQAWPWRNGSWQSSCAVNIQFDVRYSLTEATANVGGPIPRDVLGKFALEIVERSEQAGPHDELAFGDPPRDDDAAALSRMRTLASRINMTSRPNYSQLALDASYPLRLQGRTVLTVVAHPTIGWREFREFVVAFYVLSGDELEPVGSVTVTPSAGRLRSVRVTAGIR